MPGGSPARPAARPWASRLRGLHPAWIAVGVAAAAKLALFALAAIVTERPGDLLPLMAVKWDAEHYLCIARDGYVPPSFYASYPTGEGMPQVCNSIHFGYLYPLLVRLAGAAEASALLVSNLASLAAVGVVAWHWGLRAGVFLAFFPSWLVYGSVGLSEGVYVLLAALALAFLERPGRQLAAGAAGVLATLARWVGGLPLLVATLPWGLPWREWRAPRRYAAAAILGAAGLAMAAWFWWYTGHPTGYLWAQRPWGGSVGWPWQHFDFLLHGWFTRQGGTLAQGNFGPADLVLRDLLYLVPGAIGVALLLRRRDHRASAAYATVAFALALCTDGLPAAGFPRLLLAAFPALALLGDRLRGGWAWGAWMAVGLVEGTYGLVHHLFGYWS